VFDRVGKLLVHVLGEGGAGVVGQYPDEHDGIVLHMGAVIVLLGEELADLGASSGCRAGACDSGLDNRGQVEYFFACVCAARLAECFDASDSVCFGGIAFDGKIALLS
jgi:hypothetical protein